MTSTDASARITPLTAKRESSPLDAKLLRSVADRNVYQIVHLIYRSKNYEVQSKDYEFSRTIMIDHWNAGYSDAIRTLRHPEALQRPVDQAGVATFDVAVDGRE